MVVWLIALVCFMITGLSIMSEKMKVVRYDHNPFTMNMDVPTASKNVRLSKIGRDSNVLVNQVTGEEQGTHVTTYRKVDSAQFVKIFTANIALTFELKSAGIKTFNILLWVMQNKAIEKDLLTLDKWVLSDFLEAHKDRETPIKLSLPTFWRGLAELEKNQIIAKHIRQGWYYINPNFCFNGDRLAFTTIIERDNSTIERQQELPL